MAYSRASFANHGDVIAKSAKLPNEMVARIDVVISPMNCGFLELETRDGRARQRRAPNEQIAVVPHKCVMVAK